MRISEYFLEYSTKVLTGNNVNLHVVSIIESNVIKVMNVVQIERTKKDPDHSSMVSDAQAQTATIIKLNHPN